MGDRLASPLKARPWALTAALLFTAAACADAVLTPDAGTDGAIAVQAEFGLPPTLDAGCPLETCNGVDDDCDGRTDEDFPLGQVCEARAGSCVMVGEYSCSPDGREAVCRAVDAQSNGQPELCNEIDDDCDGRVDEGLPGDCTECTPMEETCNGLDDDCDQSVDEGTKNDCGECGDPPEEVCNEMDDDCDGQTDEGVLNGCGGCGPGDDETCNATDDDCDGTVDEETECGCPMTRLDDHPYLICSERVNWNTARERCQAQGYELVSIGDAEEDSGVFAAVGAAGQGDAWIGLTDAAQEGVWVWADGTALQRGVDYENWARGEPNNSDNEDCIVYIVGSDRNSDWDDRPCGRGYAFVCEAPQ